METVDKTPNTPTVSTEDEQVKLKNTETVDKTPNTPTVSTEEAAPTVTCLADYGTGASHIGYHRIRCARNHDHLLIVRQQFENRNSYTEFSHQDLWTDSNQQPSLSTQIIGEVFTQGITTFFLGPRLVSGYSTPLYVNQPYYSANYLGNTTIPVQGDTMINYSRHGVVTDGIDFSSCESTYQNYTATADSDLSSPTNQSIRERQNYTTTATADGDLSSPTNQSIRERQNYTTTATADGDRSSPTNQSIRERQNYTTTATADGDRSSPTNQSIRERQNYTTTATADGDRSSPTNQSIRERQNYTTTATADGDLSSPTNQSIRERQNYTTTATADGDLSSPTNKSIRERRNYTGTASSDLDYPNNQSISGHQNSTSGNLSSTSNLSVGEHQPQSSHSTVTRLYSSATASSLECPCSIGEVMCFITTLAFLIVVVAWILFI